ncbi:MAG: hypothetical protein WCJ33_00725 [Pseudomonadota bacterium]
MAETITDFDTERGVTPYNPTGRDQSDQLRLPEIRNYDFQSEQAAELNREDAIIEAMRQSEPEVLWDQKFVEMGNAARPKEETLRGYKAIMRQGSGVRNIEFSRIIYPSFDDTIAKLCGVDDDSKDPINPAFATNSPNYINYAPLRRNIAIFRNYLMVQLFPDGLYLPVGNDDASQKARAEDEKNFYKLENIAEYLGDELGGGIASENIFQKWWRSVKRFFKQESLEDQITTKFLKDANIHDIGIATIYDKVQQIQYFELPPRSETPFSDENIALYKSSTTMAKVADAFDAILPDFSSTKNLKTKEKLVSPEEALDVLGKLRLKISQGIEDFSLDILDPRQEIARKILRSTHALRGELAEIANHDPEKLNDPIILQAKDAIGQIAYRVRGDVINMLIEEKDYEKAQRIKEELELNTPAQYKTTESQISVIDLIGQIEASLLQAGKICNDFPFRSTLNTTIKPQNTEKSEEIIDGFLNIIPNLCSVESMSVEAKQISVEEARKILENLRLMSNDESSNSYRDLKDENIKIAEDLLNVSYSFNNILANLIKNDATILEDSNIISVIDAITQIACRAGNDMINNLRLSGKEEIAFKLKQRLDKIIPDKLKTFEKDISLKDLAKQLESGLNYAENITAKTIKLPEEVISAKNSHQYSVAATNVSEISSAIGKATLDTEKTLNQLDKSNNSLKR